MIAGVLSSVLALAISGNAGRAPLEQILVDVGRQWGLSASLPSVHDSFDWSVLPWQGKLGRVADHAGRAGDRLIHQSIQLLEQLMCSVPQSISLLRQLRQLRHLRNLRHRPRHLRTGGTGRC